MGPPVNRPSFPFTRYFTASTASPQMVVIPIPADTHIQKIAPGHAFYEHGAGGRFQAHKLTRDKILVFVRVQHGAHGRYIFFQNRGYGFFPFHFAHRIHLASLFALRKMGWRIALSMRKTR